MAETAAGKFEGHAVSFVHRFLMGPVPVPVVPVFLNAYYPPNQPSPSRCLALGQAIGRAVARLRPRIARSACWHPAGSVISWSMKRSITR